MLPEYGFFLVEEQPGFVDGLLALAFLVGHGVAQGDVVLVELLHLQVEDGDLAGEQVVIVGLLLNLLLDDLDLELAVCLHFLYLELVLLHEA